MVEATFSIFPSDQDLYKKINRAGMLLDRRNHGSQGDNADKK
jgi:hypothetical protein